MTPGAQESYAERATRLAAATASIEPRAGFQERVLAALGREPHSWWWLVTPLARTLLPVLVALAMLASWAALRAASDTDQALAADYANAEVDW